jgi:hypothetical protein
MRTSVIAVLMLFNSIRAAPGDEGSASRSVAALPGRDVVRPIKPDWCDDAALEDAFANPAGLDRVLSMVQRSVESGYSEKTLRQVGQVACVHPNDPEFQQRVAAWRQGWINLVGISEKDDREAIRARLSESWEQQGKDYCAAIAPGEEASSEERSLTEALAAGTGCGDTALGVYANDMNRELGWWIDARAQTSSEIVRAVYVTRCMRILHDADWPDPKSTWVMQAFATCGPDARRLDRARLDKELAGARFNDFARVHAREVFALAKTVYSQLESEYKKLAEKDEAYRALLFDAPEAGWSAWEKSYAANREAFEAARAFEAKFRGPSRKATAGCGPSLRKNFASYLKARKPADVEQARAAALDEVGAVLLEGLMLCDAVEGRLEAAKTEGRLLREGVVRRGPRHAAYQATLGALSAILADRPRFPIRANEFYLRIEQPRDTLYQAASDLWTNNILEAEDPQGQIASVKKADGGVVVAFKAVTTMVWNRVCKETNKIESINASGQVAYRRDCWLDGKIPVTTREKPLFVPAELAEGLRAGDTATFDVDWRHEPAEMRNGVPKQIYSGKDAKKLVVFYGVAL